MLQRVEELFEVIKASHEELLEIREACDHPSYTVGDWSWGIGRIVSAKICDRCKDNIGPA